jgi:hypothetical protein
VIVIRCDVLCGSVAVRRPDWLMRRRARLAAAEPPDPATVAIEEAPARR